MDKDIELTSYLLRYLLKEGYFESKREMAETLDVTKRILQRLMNEPEKLKRGSESLGKVLCYFAIHYIPLDDVLAEYIPMFGGNLPSRVVNNLSCCMAGLRLMEAACNRLGWAWSQVFSISLDGCAKYMEYAAREYLLDGGDSNKSIVETTLEVIDRMGLTADECRMLEDGNVAIWFKGIYDRYTQYRRDHAILGECLPYGQFMKQLRKSDLFIEGKVIQIGEDVKRGTILNYPLLCQRCDVDGFLHTHVEPLR